MERRSWSLDPRRGFERADHLRFAAAKADAEGRWRRARSAGLLGTVLLHFLLFLIFNRSVLPPPSDIAAAGPPAGDIRAAAGGSGMTMVEVRFQQEEPQPEVEPEPEVVPIPEPVVEPIEIEVPDEPVEPEPAPEVAVITPPSLPGQGGPGSGGDEGEAAGPGTDAGDGDGGGGTSEAGESRVIPPTPRGIFIPPPGPPRSARGQEITVWVYVSEGGRVERSSVRLEPPTSDDRYNRRLIESVAEWVFDPARQDGRPVPTWYPFQIIL